MKALFFTASKCYEIRDIAKPEIKRDDEVLVRVDAASICGTDIHILTEDNGAGMATPGMILGHEACGTVEEIGTGVNSLRPGDKVVFDPMLPCGECFMCRHGEQSLCSNLKIRGCMGGADGFFREYVVVRSAELIKTAPELPCEMAVFAEPVNCVLNAVDKVRALPGENVLILGSGPIGLYFMQLLKKNGAGRVMVSEISEYRKKYAEELGADMIIDPSKQSLIETVKKECEGVGPDIVIDAVGCLANDAIKAVRPG